MKEFKVILNILLLLYCSCRYKVEAQDIALSKPYSVSPSPNYSLSAKDVNNTILTDGVNSSGNPFWVSDKTVGWQNTQRIVIDIDLKQVSIIDNIAFNTARGNNSDVHFPAHIFAFGSINKLDYSYFGDAISDTSNSGSNYEVKKFTLPAVKQKAQYVKLIIIPKGYYVFCDEIEIFKGSQIGKSSPDIIKPDDVNGYVNSLLSITRYRSDLKRNNYALNAGISENLKQIKADRLHSYQEQYKKELIVDKVSPWTNLLTPYKPINSNDYQYRLYTPVNGTSYGAFVVTNLSNATRTINCVINNTALSVNRLQLYTVPFVMSGKESQEVADPLLVYNTPVVLVPGESKMFLFTVLGKSAGKTTATIKISSETFVTNLQVDNTVWSNNSLNKDSINAVNWAYLNNPLISDRSEEAINDLLKHGINTMVIPPTALPLIGSSDFKSYESYISKLKSFKKLFLFVNFNNKNNFKGTSFMSAEWQGSFIKWYNGILASSKLYGFSQSQIYLYPYDEIGAKDVDDFYSFLAWIKSNYPAIHTFATIDKINSIKKIVPLLSIAQVINSKDVIDEINGSAHNDVWIYDTKPNAESLSPYTYYRLISWKAFLYNMDGVGFWNYADINNPSVNKLNLNSFDGVNNTNYSVIYRGSGPGFIASRRWEAFSEGIEDFKLLKLYAEKSGIGKAKLMAESVINSPDDITRADSIRNQILSSLSILK
ncbi:hypothetical protein FO440_02490 [Mucilaginibacter corticis]|uniref:DUF4091 domain-containing protein n=1 Tax=Mucilaginibacter corticis TaxID=2597670 RepID=A0A556MTE2_9SPHI|nr:hypothetical protein [Mucilaginibacter corticis]TSJ43078.1 hypothetical protein FO440_02490 [Mucilaginibacter corticis]